MLLKLSKLFAVSVAAFFAVITLLIIRFWWLTKSIREETGASGQIVVDVYLLMRSPWVLLGMAVIVALAGWIYYRWINS